MITGTSGWGRAYGSREKHVKLRSGTVLAGLILCTFLVRVPAQPIQVLEGSQGGRTLPAAGVFSVGDWNGDGTRDLAGRAIRGTCPYAPLETTLVVIDGRTLNPLFRRNLPGDPNARLEAAGDWNQDGIQEVLFQSSSTSPVEVRRIDDWSLLQTFFAASVWAEMADHTQDGVPDFAAIYPDFLTPGLPHRIRIIDGSSGQLAREVPLNSTMDRALMLVPARNGNAGPEFLIRTEGAQSRHLTILDGIDGTTLLDVPLSADLLVGTPLTECKIDLDRDGHIDLVNWAYGNPNSPYTYRLLVTSTLDGSTLLTTASVGSWSSYPVDLGDRDQDGRNEVGVFSVEFEDFFTTLPAQSNLRILDGASGAVIDSIDRPYTSSFGLQVMTVDDLTGDGRVDLYALSENGIEIVDGAALTPALVMPNRPTGDRFGFRMHRLDVDGDGIEDLGISAPGTLSGGSYFVYSGVDGHAIRRFDAPRVTNSFGEAAIMLDDLDGDSAREIAISAPEDHSPSFYKSGVVFIFSGASGAPLQEYTIPENHARFGHRMQLSHDVDGDGRRDLLIAAPSGSRLDWVQYVPVPIGPGYVYNLSAATGAILGRCTGFGAHFGSELLTIPDQDGDSRNDLLVIPATDGCLNYNFYCASPWLHYFSTGSLQSLSFSYSLNHLGNLRALPYSSVPGALVRSVAYAGTLNPALAPNPGIPPSVVELRELGSQALVWSCLLPEGLHIAKLRLIEDLTGDGLADIAAEQYEPSVRVAHIDGRTGSLLGSSAYPGSPRFAFGTERLAVPDRNGDHFEEMAVADSCASVGGIPLAGRVTVWPGLYIPAGGATVGVACAGPSGPPPTLGVHGAAPIVGEAMFSLGVGPVISGSSLLVAACSGLASASWSLGGCAIYLDPTLPLYALPVVGPPLVSASGDTSMVARLPIPNSASLHGVQLHFQAAVLSPFAANGAFSTTNALSITIP